VCVRRSARLDEPVRNETAGRFPTINSRNTNEKALDHHWIWIIVRVFDDCVDNVFDIYITIVSISVDKSMHGSRPLPRRDWSDYGSIGAYVANRFSKEQNLNKRFLEEKARR